MAPIGCSGTWSLAARIGKFFVGLKRSHANSTNVGSSSGHARKDIGRLKMMGQSNINSNVLNKMEQEGLDGTIVGAMEIAKKALHKALVAQEDATEVHHVKTVHPILATLEEQFIALLFGCGNVNVALDKTRMLGHIRYLPKDLVSTHSIARM